MFGYAYWNTRNAVQNSYVPVAHTNIRNGCKLMAIIPLRVTLEIIRLYTKSC